MSFLVPCACLQELNAAPVVPEGFPCWQPVMDGWGSKMVAATEVGVQVHGVHVYAFKLQRCIPLQ